MVTLSYSRMSLKQPGFLPVQSPTEILSLQSQLVFKSGGVTNRNPR